MVVTRGGAASCGGNEGNEAEEIGGEGGFQDTLFAWAWNGLLAPSEHPPRWRPHNPQAGADSDFEIDLVSSGEEEEAASGRKGGKGKGKAPPKKKTKQTPAEQPAAKVGGSDCWHARLGKAE